MTDETADRLHELGLPPGARPVAFVCTVCGDEFHGSPSMDRFLAGSKGDHSAAGLCWVCRRLYLAAVAEAKAMRVQFAPCDEPPESTKPSD